MPHQPNLSRFLHSRSCMSQRKTENIVNKNPAQRFGDVCLSVWLVRIVRTAHYTVHSTHSTARILYLFNRINFENVHNISFSAIHLHWPTIHIEPAFYFRANECDCVSGNSVRCTPSVVFRGVCSSSLSNYRTQHTATSHIVYTKQTRWTLMDTNFYYNTHLWACEIVMHSRCSRTHKINSCLKIVSSIDKGDIEFHLENWFSKAETTRSAI